MNRQKGQMQIIFGIAVILVVVGVVLGFKWLLGGSEDEEVSEEPEQTQEESAPGSDATGNGAPVRTDLFPTGTLPAGTTKTTISVSLNEAGYCRYSTKSGQSYDSMRERFSTDETKTFHTETIKGLKNGQTYAYYVRCKDLAGNRNTSDAIIQFTVGGASPYSGSSGYTGSSSGVDTTPPQRTDLFPTGTLPAGTLETQISVTINEPGYCRYSTKAGQSYGSMRERFSSDSSKTFHTETVKGLSDNEVFEYYVRCRDTKGNENTTDAVIRFGVGGIVLPTAPGEPGEDMTPPYCFEPWPDGEDLPYSTKKVVINLKTNENATCRYGLTSGLSYYSMNRFFSNTGSTYHSTEVTGLSEGGSYKYYVKCVDENDNPSTEDLVISFDVEEPEDLTPPVRSNFYPTIEHPLINAPTGQITISLDTNEPAYCRYDYEQGKSYGSMKYRFDRFTETSHYKKITVEQYEFYNIFIRCKDAEGNENTSDVMLSFQPY